MDGLTDITFLYGLSVVKIIKLSRKFYMSVAAGPISPSKFHLPIGVDDVVAIFSHGLTKFGTPCGTFRIVDSPKPYKTTNSVT